MGTRKCSEDRLDSERQPMSCQTARAADRDRPIDHEAELVARNGCG
jgi:hypothetical protein